jgi:cyanophycin synthetase
MVLRDPTVDFAVLETARGGILRAGLGFDYCDIGIITNVSEDHLGQRGIETLDDLAYVKSVVIEVVRRDGHSILNAEDPHLVPLAERAGGQLCYFSFDPNNDVLQQHVQQGGIGATLRDHSIIILKGQHELPVINLNSIPATLNGRAVFNVANAMVAALAAHLAGASLDDIRAGLKTFDTHFYLSPGRLNMEEVGDFHVLLDYAHNPAAYRNVASFIRQLNVGRRIGVVAAPGDRRDVDIETMGLIAGEAFDRLIIKEDDNRRERAAGEVAEVMKRGALAAGLQTEAIEVILSEVEAVDYALRQARKDDLIVITADNIKRTFEQILKFRDERAVAVGV